MPKPWDEDFCNETSGFLFNHDCQRAPINHCGQCNKPICDEHSHQNQSEILCTECAKKIRQHGSRQRGQAEDYQDWNDPYFYAGYYYGSSYTGSYHAASRNDPHDFTEADGESLDHESDEGFENDMSES